MSDYYEVTAISADKKHLEEVGKKQKVNTYHINLTREITPLIDLKAVFKLYKYLKKEKPLIVHSHTPKAGIVAMLASYFAKVPLRLHTVAGLPLLETNGVKRKILNIVEKLTYSCATRVYPNSFGLKEIILEQNFCKASKLKVIANGSSNGIDTSYFNPNLFAETEKNELKQTLNIKADDFVFIFVGRIVTDKGINELIEAFSKLSINNRKVKLILVGDTEDQLDPLKKITKNNILRNEQIISVGYQDDVRPYFSISDVLVFPSYREGFPNVVMQAGAMNIMSIVTEINGCNEIIQNNVNGLIIPVKNSNAIYNAMIEIINNESQLILMKTNSRKQIVVNYEQNTVWSALLSEYQNL